MARPAHSTPIAKLTRPKLPGVQRRTRLFRSIDRLRRGHRVIWISGPPGAGKTALVASYLDARKLRGLWFELDAGDADPATFFHFLALAAPKSRQPLPAFTPAHLADLPGFARRFARALFERVRTPAVIVFDDVHALGDPGLTEAALAAVLSELPQGITAIVTSRGEPSPAWAKLSATRALGRLAPEDLRFTHTEVRGIARPARLPPEAIVEAERLADGWAAGLVLLLDPQRHRGAEPELGTPAERHRLLFDYFADQVFTDVPPEVRRFWLATSFLPHVTAEMAAKVSGDPSAAEKLEALYRRNLFVQRRAGANGPRYHFHALLSEFLRARARQTFDAEQIAAWIAEGARLLEADGQLEDAVEAFTEAGRWADVARVISTAARTLLAQGRNQQLVTWIQRVPAPVRAKVPWLTYWLAMARMPFHQIGARTLFEEAFSGFHERGDAVGALLASAGVLESYSHEFNDFHPADPWIAAFEGLVAQLAPALTPELQCALLGAVQTIQVRRPQSPALEEWLTRTLKLSREAPQAWQRMMAAHFALSRCIWSGDFRTAEKIVSESKRTSDAAEVPPIVRMLWKIYQALYEWQTADHDASERTLDEVHAIARVSGVGFLEFITLGSRVYAMLSKGDLPRARVLIARMEALLVPSRTMDVNYLANLKTGVALLAGDGEAARHWAAVSVKANAASGAPFNEAIAHNGMGQALLLCGDTGSARTSIVRALGFAREMHSVYVEWLAQVALAQCELAAGRRDEACAAIRDAFAIGRAQGFVNCHPFWSQRGMSRLCAVALAEGIEPDYARRLIRVRGLTPESPDATGWPWPLQLRALGNLEVVRDGEELALSGKGQQKPLELLKAIIAAGGRDVGATALATAVWPDAEGDKARTLLEVNLHRLRKLLGQEDAIVVTGGRIRLDERRCWLDVWAFERLAASIRRGEVPREGGALAALVEALHGLYRTDLLPDDDSEPWTLRPRDRLAERYAETVFALGEAFQKARAFDAEASLYRAALERHPDREELYRRLMRACVDLERPAEALDVYRRCRANLSKLSGSEPSRATERLRASLIGAA